MGSIIIIISSITFTCNEHLAYTYAYEHAYTLDHTHVIA